MELTTDLLVHAFRQRSTKIAIFLMVAMLREYFAKWLFNGQGANFEWVEFFALRLFRSTYRYSFTYGDGWFGAIGNSYGYGRYNLKSQVSF